MFEERPISFVSHGAAGRQHVFCPSNHGRTWTGSFDCSVSGREVAERRRLAIQNLAWPMYDVRYDVDIRMYSTDKICKQTSLSISSTCNKRIPTKIGPNAPQNRNRPGAMGVKFKLLPVNLGVRTMLRFSSRTESQNSGQVILWDVSAPSELQTLKNFVFIQKSCNCRSLSTSGGFYLEKSS